MSDKFLKWDANITFSSSREGESQAHLTHMSTVKQFRFFYPYSSSETMIYENVLTWKRKLIKNEKFINVEVEEFSGVASFLRSSFFRFSLWVILPPCQLSVTELNVPANSLVCLFPPLPVQVINQRTMWMLLPVSIKLGQKCNGSRKREKERKKKKKIRQ